MFLAIAFSLMLISSIYLLLYTNHLTVSNQEEIKKAEIQKKFRDPLPNVQLAEADKQLLSEAV